MQKGHSLNKPKVFISHRHLDRHVATQLQSVLHQHGAETFLDQDRIQAGDVLPDRIQDGIKWCDIFLLLWSGYAASSDWVAREWDLAYESRKKIIPYLLDQTPLPNELDNLVHVEDSDRLHGNAQLLLAVFGKEFVTDSTTLFPGRWKARMDAMGMVQATYNLELRANGQVEGDGGADASGVAIGMARQLGMEGLFTMRIPVHGSWSYDQGTQILAIEMNAAAFGQQTMETIRIHTTGREKGAILGRDLGGRTWTLEREVSEKPSKTRLASFQGSENGFVVCPHCSAQVKGHNLNSHIAKVHREK
jgi:TIR domain